MVGRAGVDAGMGRRWPDLRLGKVSGACAPPHNGIRPSPLVDKGHERHSGPGPGREPPRRRARRRAAGPDARAGRHPPGPALPLPRPGRRRPGGRRGRAGGGRPGRRGRPHGDRRRRRRGDLRVGRRARRGRHLPRRGRHTPAPAPCAPAPCRSRSPRTGSPRSWPANGSASPPRRSRRWTPGPELDTAIEAVGGLPAVLKTRRGGYDGKGQAVLREPSDVDAAWDAARRRRHRAPDPRALRAVPARALGDRGAERRR